MKKLSITYETNAIFPAREFHQRCYTCLWDEEEDRLYLEVTTKSWSGVFGFFRSILFDNGNPTIVRIKEKHLPLTAKRTLARLREDKVSR